MKLDAWTEGDVADNARRKRLTVGYAVGAVTVAVALTFVTYSAHGQAFTAEETIDVSLAKAPVIEKAPEPESTPPPEPKPRAKKPRKKGKVSVATPKDVPDNVPEEATEGSTPYDGDYDDVFGGEGGDGAGDSAKAAMRAPPAAPKPQPQVAAPIFVSEREKATPPIAIERRPPRYPEEARSEGVEGVVTVRFVVSPNGTVGDVRVVSGHPLLNAAVIAAVKTWRFEPAKYEDRPISMWQTARFPFRINNG
jgi:protein TonB